MLPLCMASCADGRKSFDKNMPMENGMTTLRAESEKRSSDTSWTRELEGERLANDVQNPLAQGAESKVSATPEIAALFLSKNSVYPILPDFGSLDISSFTPDVRRLIDDFCEKILEGGAASNFSDIISDDAVFSLVFFLHDINEIKSTVRPKSADDENDARVGEMAEEAADKTVAEATDDFFTSYIIGAPYIIEDGMEIPVRFYFGEDSGGANFISNVSTTNNSNVASNVYGYIDVAVFTEIQLLENAEGDLQEKVTINQVRITKTEVLNEQKR